MVLIQFITNGSSTVLGNFGPGDRIRVKPDMARHLVEEARCAKYVEQASAPLSPPDTPAGSPAAAPEKPAIARRPRARRAPTQQP
ncbi:MAG: hypothetical protein KJ023_00030 [Burkholderiaceae bacterium]|nr:hypothetical protein [Burkholderiaceae bacterium]